MVRPVIRERTCPVSKIPLWMLTGLNLTLGFHGERCVRSLGEAERAHVSRCGTGVFDPVSGVSGHHLTMKTAEI